MLIDARDWRGDILEEHVEELGFLWNRRLRAARSPALDGVALWRLDRRIDAHADALVLAGAQAGPLLWPTLTGDETPAALGAAFVLASDDSDETNHRLIEGVHAAPAPARSGLRQGLALRCGPRLLAVLSRMTGFDHDTVAVTAAAIVTAHGQTVAAEALSRWLASPEPDVRRAAWLAAGRQPTGQSRAPGSLPDSVWSAGLRDPDAGVRWAALMAAVRTGQRLLLGHLRETAGRPSLATVDEHVLFAMLAEPADTESVLALAAAPVLGWERFRILAALGRQAAGQALLAAIEGETDPAAAALAGAAFTQVTGADIQTPARVPLVPAGTPPADTELADEIKCCDPQRARRAWKAVTSLFQGHASRRMARGALVDELAPAQCPGHLDLEARLGVQARAALAHPGAAVVFDDQLFPLPRPLF